MNKNQRKKLAYWNKIASKYDKVNLKKNSVHHFECIRLLRNSIEENSSIIDLGCGTGQLTYAISDIASSIQGVDFSEVMISICLAKKRSPKHDNIHFSIGNSEYTGIKEQSFDVTLIGNLLDYLEDPQITLLEAKRITRKNGLIVTHTFCNGTIYSPTTFFRVLFLSIAQALNLIPYMKFYSFHKLRKVLESSGMVIISERKIKHNGRNSLFAVIKT
jgi:ubiquinone/menaquinone biosynthesis C-methylase UbiE